VLPDKRPLKSKLPRYLPLLPWDQSTTIWTLSPRTRLPVAAVARHGPVYPVSSTEGEGGADVSFSHCVPPFARTDPPCHEPMNPW
jgi:hypothetical protein